MPTREDHPGSVRLALSVFEDGSQRPRHYQLFGVSRGKRRGPYHPNTHPEVGPGPHVPGSVPCPQEPPASPGVPHVSGSVVNDKKVQTRSPGRRKGIKSPETSLTDSGGSGPRGDIVRECDTLDERETR